ncbi:hypothetical protein BH11BAC2_BH11BAC2_01420 [soil metagenome]
MVTLFVSCKKASTSSDVLPAGCDTIAMSYSGNIKSIISNNCSGSGCHSSGSQNGSFTSYTELKDEVDDGDINNQVFVRQQMPPGGMDNCDRLKLKAWINAGALNN